MIMPARMLPGIFRGQLRSSHLSQVTPENSTEWTVEEDKQEPDPGPDFPERSTPQDFEAGPIQRICSLRVHDENFSKDEAILNFSLFPPRTVATGDLMQISALTSDASKHLGHNIWDGDDSSLLMDRKEMLSFIVDPKKYYIFVVTEMSAEASSKHPKLQVSRFQPIYQRCLSISG